MPSISSKAAKVRSIWVCQECGTSQPKWVGQCPGCKLWNTLQEEQPTPVGRRDILGLTSENRPIALSDVEPRPHERISCGLGEMDRLLGGGVVPGSFTLVGGEPGIGKSTLMLQTAAKMAGHGHTVLYVCGEESVEQTSLRAKRLGIKENRLLLLCETQFEAIKHHIDIAKPDVLVIDSIQIIYRADISSAPGSVVQVREVASDLMHLAKGRNLTTFVIGHVTKSGEIAGPRVLEHLVDTVLYFEGEKHLQLRLLRVVKNRFGSTDEIALFHMEPNGLRDVLNPSELFLEERARAVSGSAVVATVEGSRPLLVEVQALVTASPYSAPSRRSTGVDQNRVALLIAVLEKRVGYTLAQHDVFVAAAGGFKLNEPATDLAVLCAIASSLTGKVIPQSCVLLGEVGLGGEVRAVARAEVRLKEAAQLGFKEALVPQRTAKNLSAALKQTIRCIPVAMVEEAIEKLWSLES